MHHFRQLAHAALLMSAIALAVVCSGRTKAVAEQFPSASADLVSPTVVLRGSVSDEGDPSAVVSDAPVVLRGSPAKPEPGRTAGYACPRGYVYDPGSGCVAPDYGYVPDSYGYPYWPYWGVDGFHRGGGRRFAHAFAHGVRAGATVRFGHRSTDGFRRGFGHLGGFR